MAAEININQLNTMKKTLITLLSLAGVAMAEETWQDTFTVPLDITSTAISLDSGYLSLTLNSIGGASTNTYAPAEVTGAEGFSPKIQFVQHNNDGCYWTLDFTLQNNSIYGLTLTGFSFDMFSTTATGGTHDSGLQDTKVSLSFGESVFGEGTAVLGGGSTTGTAEITGEYLLNAGESVDLTMKVQRTKDGAFTGYASISAGTMTYVIPEPATATLSLLALCGLAARRRRK